MAAGRVIGQSQPAEPIRPIYPSDPLYTYSIEPLALDVCRLKDFGQKKLLVEASQQLAYELRPSI